jgi:hypothetical protein
VEARKRSGKVDFIGGLRLKNFWIGCAVTVVLYFLGSWYWTLRQEYDNKFASYGAITIDEIEKGDWPDVRMIDGKLEDGRKIRFTGNIDENVRLKVGQKVRIEIRRPILGLMGNRKIKADKYIVPVDDNTIVEN